MQLSPCSAACPAQGEGPATVIPEDDRPVLLRASHFGPEGMLRLKGSRLARRLDAPLPSLFWAAGLSFSRACVLHEARAVFQAPLAHTARPHYPLHDVRASTGHDSFEGSWCNRTHGAALRHCALLLAHALPCKKQGIPLAWIGAACGS